MADTESKPFALGPDESALESFRGDIRQLEEEIQSYFRAYYLSGIAAFLAWLLGTKSASGMEILIGNGGYNIYALMAIALLNMVTTTFLIHKGISVHEIAQFVSSSTRPQSAYSSWERWRRSPASLTRDMRVLYGTLLIVVPLATSGLLLTIIFVTLYTQPPRLMEIVTSLAMPTPTPVALIKPTQAAKTAYATQVAEVFELARWFFWGLVGLHAIPVWGAFKSILVVPLAWKRLKNISV